MQFSLHSFSRLSFFDSLDCFRVLVCGGDGTVGWVLGAFDRLGLHNKVMLEIIIALVMVHFSSLILQTFLSYLVSTCHPSTWDWK